MASERATITVQQGDKDSFDRQADVFGGLPHVRMFSALLEGWKLLSLDQQIEAIRSTARTPDPAETTAA